MHIEPATRLRSEASVLAATILAGNSFGDAVKIHSHGTTNPSVAVQLDVSRMVFCGQRRHYPNRFREKAA